MKEKMELPAIKDGELKGVLDKFELSEKVARGEVLCASCQRVIDWDNIGALLVKDKNIVLFCDYPECIESASLGNV